MYRETRGSEVCNTLDVSPFLWAFLTKILVAHDCGYPLSRYTCGATRVAADFLDFTAFCRCSSGVAPHPLKILASRLSPPPFPGGVAPRFGCLKRCRATPGGVAATVAGVALHCAAKTKMKTHRGGEHRGGGEGSETFSERRWVLRRLPGAS